MTMLDLDAIRARLEAATKGDWRVEEERGTRRGLWYIVAHARGVICRVGMVGQPLAQEDAEFIAHAPQDVRALLAEVSRLRAEREGARPWLNEK